jgi:hypothetical protein
MVSSLRHKHDMGTGTQGVTSSQGSLERDLPAPNPLYILLSVHNAESSGPYNRLLIYLIPSSLLASTEAEWHGIGGRRLKPQCDKANWKDAVQNAQHAGSIANLHA